MASEAAGVTALLNKLTAGDSAAASQVVPLIYEELRRLAAHYMAAERPGHTLQTTALVHEAYLRLVDQRQASWQSRAHFYGAAAGVMRRILVDHARARLTAKRGGDAPHLALDEALVFSDEQSDELVRLDEALGRLAQMNPRQSRVIQLRFFAGLTVEEISEVMGISPKTVKRDWSFARAWLHRELRGRPGT
jgi:RNA polymerase sigma factor (TIGR02999 family)